MILGKVKIQNFKSIKDTGWIYLSKGDLINILAGQNESGKTAFLKALDFFQKGEEYANFDDEDRRMETHPRVDCTFYMSNQEYLELKKRTNKKIADFYKKNGFNFLRGDTEEDNFILRYSYPEEIKEFVQEFNQSLVDDSTDKSDEKTENDPDKFDPYQYFYDIKPDMVFYSSFSSNILPGKVAFAEIDTNQAVQDFENVYKVNFKDLLKPITSGQKRAREEARIRKDAADSLNNYWNQHISDEEVEYSFSITLRPDADINNSYIDFYINQGDEPQLKIAQKSQGFQWFVGFNLRLRAHEQSLDNNGLILLIDEPGQGLHEIAQEDVRNVIEELAQKSKMQIIYSTHQPVLLGKENIDFSRLLLVDRKKENGSKFKTISQLVSSSGSRDSLAPIRSALGLVSIKNLPSKKLAVVAEGITEYFYLKTLFKSSYSVIPSAGVDQVPNIFAILFGWGINTKVLVDDDMQGRKAFNKIKKEFFNKQETEEFKNTIYKLSDCNGIEDLISIQTITEILSEYGKEYLNDQTKIENVKQVGKFIFAKSFYDKFNNNLGKLDEKTKENFKKVKTFLDA